MSSKTETIRPGRASRKHIYLAKIKGYNTETLLKISLRNKYPYLVFLFTYKEVKGVKNSEFDRES